MKNSDFFKLMSVLILALVGAVMLTSCNPPTPKNGELPVKKEYYYDEQYIIPDTLKEAAALYTADLVRSASNHLSTTKYEDLDDTIREAEMVSLHMYGKLTPGLQLKLIYPDTYISTIFIPFYQLDSIELSIFQKYRDIQPIPR